MKKINIKSLIIGIFIGVLISSGIVYAGTYLYQANEIGYTTSKNTSVTNVNEAINDLYDKAGNTLDMSNAELIYLGNAKNIIFSKDYSYVIVVGSFASGGYSGVEAMYTTSATMSTGGYTNEYILNDQNNPAIKIFTNVKKDATLSITDNHYNHWETYMGILNLYVTVIGIP